MQIKNTDFIKCLWACRKIETLYTTSAAIQENNSQRVVDLHIRTAYSLTNPPLCTCPMQTLTPIQSHLVYESSLVFSAPGNPTIFPMSIYFLLNFPPLIPSLPSSHSADDLRYYLIENMEAKIFPCVPIAKSTSLSENVPVSSVFLPSAH